MQALRNPVVVVLGATGAGKSRLALELGIRFNGEIISADSMQVYKGLDIITNKVTPEEQRQCPHHALGMVHPLQRFTVVDFRNRVIPLIDGLISRGRTPIIVGGTNYYIEALLWKVLLTNEGSSNLQGLMFETRGEVDRLRLRLRSKRTVASHRNSDKTHSELSETVVELQRKTETRESRLNDANMITTAPNQSKSADHPPCDRSDQSETTAEGASSGMPIQSRTDVEFASHEVESKVNKDNTRTDQPPRLVPDSNSAESDIGGAVVVPPTNEFDVCLGASNLDHVDSEVMDVEVGKMESSELHRILQDIDPQMACKLHPNDRRKIIRSLQVYEQHGVCHSKLLQEQRDQEGGSHLGGPLRYSDTCVFWVQTEQSVLDTRLDKRVDGMMNAGLVKELEDFHKEYNEQRLAGNIKEEELYTQGIFQSIGFKEFHPYLVISDDKKRSDDGQKLLEESIERLKTATKQYARRQLKWIRNRFLKRGSNSPSVYGLDATKPEEWNKNVFEPAASILQAMRKGQDSLIPPLPCEEREVNDQSQIFVCDVCRGRQFVGQQQWTAHVKSRRHQKQARKKRLQELMNIEYTKRQASSSCMQESGSTVLCDSIQLDRDDVEDQIG